MEGSEGARSSAIRIKKYKQVVAIPACLKWSRAICDGRIASSVCKSAPLFVFFRFLRDSGAALVYKDEGVTVLPDISVIMAVYQVAHQEYLDMAIRSILCQTFADLELIVCSDGADSETYATIQRWSRRDNRIIITKNTRNLGAGAARNKAFSLSSGKYIAVMDADDMSAPERLDRTYRFLEANRQYAFAGTRGAYFYHEPGDRQDGYWYVEHPTARNFLMTLPFVHASILFRREPFEAVGGYRTLQRVMRSEDYDLLLRLYEQGFQGCNLPEALYYIRMDEAAIRRRKYRYRFFECAVKLEGFFKLGLMPAGVLYGLKPLIVGLIPNRALCWMKRKYYGG